MHAAPLSVQPRRLAVFILALAPVTIVVSLLLTQFYPQRFHIHPLPYLSDAGLRDPERYILSLGLALSAAAFVPLSIALYLDDTLVEQRIASLGLAAGIIVSLSLNIFTTVPGYYAPHHIFAGIFAGSAGTWSGCHAMISRRREGWTVRTKLLCGLTSIQTAVIVVFAIIWTSIKLQMPYKMIPNKDPRFNVLAIGEYIGTSAFLIAIDVASRRLKQPLLLQLGHGGDLHTV